jgi:hypothetical protein
MPEYKYPESYQLRVLACWVRKPKFVKGLIEANYFSNATQQDIAGCVEEIRKGHEDASISKVELVAMMRAFNGKKKTSLWSLYKRAIRKIYKQKLSDVRIMVEQIRAFQVYCKRRAALVAALRDVDNGKGDAGIKKVLAVKHLGSKHSQDEVLDLWEAITNPDEWEEDREGLVATRLTLLDKALGGGLAAGELGIVEAPPKVGKSSMLARLGVGAMRDYKKVAFATGELSAAKTRKRIYSMLTGIPYWELTKQAYKPAGTIAQLKQMRKLMPKGEMKIKGFPSGKARIQDVEAWVEELKSEGFKTDILIVDYLMTFRSNSNYDERRLDIGQSAIDLRGLAQEQHIPVWTAAQTNRAGLTKATIGPGDLAEDISLFFTLDFLLAICQSEEERGKGDGKPEKARLLLYGRDVARSATIKIEIDRPRFAIKEMGYA